MKQIRDINRSNRQNEKDNEEWMIYVIQFCGRKADGWLLGRREYTAP